MKIMRQVRSYRDAELLQDDLDRFQRYCIINQLHLNVTKCFVCSFTRKPNPIVYTYKLSQTTINRVSVIKDLGVKFDSKLLFDSHIEEIVDKAAKALGFIFRISSDFKNIKTMKILYCAFVRSHLEYSSQIWNPNYKVHIDRLESIQRRFLRYIQFRANCYLPTYNDRCRKFHILPLCERRKVADLAFLIKVMNGVTDVPELLNQINLRAPSLFLRKGNLLQPPKANTLYRQNSYLLRVCNTYNTECKKIDIDMFNLSVQALKKKMNTSFFH